MKAKALTKFYDSVAKKIRQQGDIFGVTPARFNEICLKGNFVEKYDEPEKVVEETTTEETE